MIVDHNLVIIECEN